jgi:hypothetical protein
MRVFKKRITGIQVTSSGPAATARKGFDSTPALEIGTKPAPTVLAVSPDLPVHSI